MGQWELRPRSLLRHRLVCTGVPKVCPCGGLAGSGRDLALVLRCLGPGLTVLALGEKPIIINDFILFILGLIHSGTFYNTTISCYFVLSTVIEICSNHTNK